MANQANIIVGAASISIAGTDVGYTRGGVQIRYQPTFTDIDADQANGIVKKARNMERMFVRFNMLEVQIANLRTAFMYPVANLSAATSLYLGYNDACWVDENEITITGKGPSCGTRTWTFSRGIVSGEREYSATRENAVEFAIEFEILKDTNGRFGTVIDS